MPSSIKMTKKGYFCLSPSTIEAASSREKLALSGVWTWQAWPFSLPHTVLNNILPSLSGRIGFSFHKLSVKYFWTFINNLISINIIINIFLFFFFYICLVAVQPWTLYIKYHGLQNIINILDIHEKHDYGYFPWTTVTFTHQHWYCTLYKRLWQETECILDMGGMPELYMAQQFFSTNRIWKKTVI